MSTNNEKKRPKVRGKFQLRHDQSKMRFEVERIKTFKTWSKTCPVKPGPLAEAGFYYVGIFDRVECFSCRGQIEEWKEGDTVVDVHETMYPHCDMVRNQEKTNITIETWNEMKKSLKPESMGSEVDGQTVLRVSKTQYLMTSKDYVDAYWGTSFTGKSTRAHAPLLDEESRRQDTFRDWPEECKLSRSETKWLANAGFVFTGPGDRARCFWCNGAIECWEEDDEPWSEHARNFPNCEWLIEMKGKAFVDEVQNAKASEEAEKREPKQSPAASTQSSPSGKSTRAHDPLHEDESRRQDTFRDWPDEGKLSRSETKWLANAGFVFTGPGDRARCFWCNGAIEYWEEDDEPWSEHARNFPNCEWLIEMKGKAFVDEVQNAKASEEAEKRESKQSPAASTQSSQSDHQKTPASEAGQSEKDKKVSATQLVEIMSRPTVKMIMKSGFDAALVCRVLEEQLHETDLNFSSSDNFIKTLEEAEIRKNSTDEESVQSSVNIIDMQTQRFANLEINNDSRQEESTITQSGQKSFVTAKSSEYKQVSSTTSSTGYLPDVGPKKVMCKVCKRQDVATILHPCNHEVACLQCTRVATTCPQCATHITNYRRISIML